MPRSRCHRYDYAAQDPINNYDLSGTLVGAVSEGLNFWGMSSASDSAPFGKPAKSNNHVVGLRDIERFGIELAEHSPEVLGGTAVVVCVITTGGACAVLAYGALGAGLGKSILSDTSLGGGKNDWSKLTADVSIDVAFFGAGRALDWAFSPPFMLSGGDQRFSRALYGPVLLIGNSIAMNGR